jgi:acetyltransferase-like isoleucine patch superfamily enzyme
MNSVKLVLTDNSLGFFEANNISFHNRFGIRLRVGDEIRFLQDLSVEPYIGFHAGKNLFEMGYMSYSNSQLPVDVKIGRYCSIASGLSFISYNHPWECLSTSVFTHDRKTDLTARTLRDFLLVSGDFKILPNPQKPQVVVENDVWIGRGYKTRNRVCNCC